MTIISTRGFYVDFAREELNSPEIQQRELVLQYIALFKRFGFGVPVIADAQTISEKVQAANPLVTWSRFQKIVDDLKRRKILPRSVYALHHTKGTPYQVMGRMVADLREFHLILKPSPQDLPAKSKLIAWFHEMFQYAAESEPASRIVRDLLGPNGPFQDGEYLKTRLGSHFFKALAEADPKSALKCVMRTIGTWDKDALLQFTIGRRDVIWALEKIAMKRDLFC